MQIDHDLRELPHRAWKVIAAVTAVLSVIVAVLISTVLREAASVIPIEAIFIFDGVAFGLCVGFLLGRWDTLRHLQPETVRPKSQYDVVAILKYAAALLLKAPFAIFIIPAKTWQKSRGDGEGTLSRVTHVFAGFIFGLMITMIVAMAIIVPIIIATGN